MKIIQELHRRAAIRQPLCADRASRSQASRAMFAALGVRGSRVRIVHGDSVTTGDLRAQPWRRDPSRDRIRARSGCSFPYPPGSSTKTNRHRKKE